MFLGGWTVKIVDGNLDHGESGSVLRTLLEAGQWAGQRMVDWSGRERETVVEVVVVVVVGFQSSNLCYCLY